MRKITVDGHSLINKKASGFEVFAREVIPLVEHGKKDWVNITSYGAGRLSRVLNFMLLILKQDTVLVFPTNPPLFWVGALLKRTVFVCHDVGPIVNPRATQLLTRWVYPKFLRACLKYGTVVAVSEFTAQEINRLFGAKVKVIGNVCRALPEPPVPVDLPADFVNAGFFLAVGTVEPRKRYLQLLRGFKVYREQSATDKKLVIVGRLGWEEPAVIEALSVAAREGWLVWLQGATDHELHWLYEQCKCLISTSAYEGFNMPVFEALSCRKAVLVRKGTAPTYEKVEVCTFDGDDPAQIADGIKTATSFQSSVTLPDRYSAQSVAEHLLNTVKAFY